jgi:hypothetical protein
MSEPQDHSLNGIRFCSSCMTTKHVIGGTYILINKGKGRRWKCADCRQHAKERNDRVSIKKENENGHDTGS